MIRLFYNWFYKHFPPEKVKYGDRGDLEKAIVIQTKEGLKMQIRGEKYPLNHFPRGYLLISDYHYTNLAILKHTIKNKIFNYAWAELEKGAEYDIIIQEIKRVILEDLPAILEKSRFDFLPSDKLCVAVRELWRAMTTLEKESPYVKILKEALCLILQEDDGYRFRWLWMNNRIGWWMRYLGLIKIFERALMYLEDAEIICDMKDKIRLLRRVLLLVLKDKNIKNLFIKLFKELDWKKIQPRKADLYFFRGKYFKVDHRKRILGIDFRAYDY